jgi:hypothetical protein
MNEKAPRSSHGAFLEANSARGRPWGGFNFAELWDPNPCGGFRFLTNRSYAQGFEVSELIGEPVPAEASALHIAARHPAIGFPLHRSVRHRA